ncbi:MAG TPA: hypothetical protein VL096_01795, partial [Pirellulaceae bacterium]|nr:hypothetical protein [Pirellulaceae bacterium]
MGKTRYWLPGLLVTIGLALAIAQAQGPPPGRGPGGFGPPGGPGSLIMLVNIPEIQQELAIEAAQKQPIAALQSKMQEDSQEIFRGINPPQQNEQEPDERER